MNNKKFPFLKRMSVLFCLAFQKMALLSCLVLIAFGSANAQSLITTDFNREYPWLQDYKQAEK